MDYGGQSITTKTLNNLLTCTTLDHNNTKATVIIKQPWIIIVTDNLFKFTKLSLHATLSFRICSSSCLVCILVLIGMQHPFIYDHRFVCRNDLLTRKVGSRWYLYHTWWNSITILETPETFKHRLTFLSKIPLIKQIILSLSKHKQYIQWI